MRYKFKFIISSIVLFVVLMLVWFFGCFFLGLANNSEKYQFEIWIAYVITLFIHFILVFILHRRIFSQKISSLLIVSSFLLYTITAWYFYNNS